MKSAAISLLILIVSGCSSTESDEQLAKTDNGLRCERVQVLGSSIPQKVCTTSAQRENAKKIAKEKTRKLRGPAVYTKDN